MPASATPSACSPRGSGCFPGAFTSSCSASAGRSRETYIAGALALAARCGAPVVATNDVRFLKPEQFESHEARVCIHDGTLLADSGRVRRYSRQQYLRTPQEMAALFADVPRHWPTPWRSRAVAV